MGPGILIPVLLVAVVVPIGVTWAHRRFKSPGEREDEPASAPAARLTSNALRALPAPPWRVVYEITRRMITELIGSVVVESRARLRAIAPNSPADIRGAKSAVVAFPESLTADLAGLRKFLTKSVYRSRRVMDVMDRAAEVVRDLFSRYMDEPRAMPEAWQAAATGLSDRRRARVIGDFVAGMTDRYAIAEHRRLFDATPELR